ncbi:MAG TPA: toxin-antitoxin system HicB family antitoxin [Pirellulales bacterium]|jgi:predicted HicB family RNase H-like nuclease|nr:toxin-antitoxin system HicB family antitoxin [Pirellulales bacterium]
MGERELQVQRAAQELYEQSPDWVSFFRAVLGVGGLVRETFKSSEELQMFEHSPEYSELQQMVARLRERSGDAASVKEPTRVITVRLPQSLHESLRLEAHERRTSMNKLCISKLLQLVDGQLVPAE